MRANLANPDTVTVNLSEILKIFVQVKNSNVIFFWQKQTAALNKMTNHVLDLINTAREDWEASERGGIPSTFSNNDTQELVAALSTGKAFKVLPGPQQLVRQTSTPTASTPQG